MNNKFPIFTDKFIKRFWGNVDMAEDNDKCWLWKGGREGDKYGRLSFKRVDYLSHRVAFFISNKIDPAEFCVCHKCDVKSCCRPSHLFLGTHKDNTKDMISKGRANMVGEKNGAAILAESKIIEIVKRYSKGDITQFQLSKIYGVSHAQANNIVHLKLWKHLESELKEEMSAIRNMASYHPRKVTDVQVNQIRTLYKQGVGPKQLAKDFCIGATHIYRIINGESRFKSFKQVV